MLSLFAGHPMLMRVLDDADGFLLLPTAAIAQAQRTLQANAQLWEPFLLFTGVRAMELTEHTAIEAGRIPGPITVTQVVFEAQTMNAVVVTASPDDYAGHTVALAVLP
jgi:hypothetical protein